MTPKEFAELNAGRKCIMDASYAGNANPNARVIGYSTDPYSNQIIVEPEGSSGWPIGSALPSSCIILCSDVVNGWWIHMANVTIVEPERPMVPVKAYPSTCKICKKPARKVGRNTMCSNSKCKSLKVLRSTYKSKVPIKYKTHIENILSTGRIISLVNWAAGNCAVCLQSGRNNQPWMHNTCWSTLKPNEQGEIMRLCAAYKELKTEISNANH